MINRQDTNIAVELALLVALATLWGGSYTFIKLGVATIPPITLIAARTAIAGLLRRAARHAQPPTAKQSADAGGLRVDTAATVPQARPRL
ncbi:hypothetical protein ACS229_28220, partial [Klebsiella pneumoniae]